MAILVHEYSYIYLCHAFLIGQGCHTNGRIMVNDAAIPPVSIEMTCQYPWSLQWQHGDTWEVVIELRQAPIVNVHSPDVVR
jgi:hypothetical protein